MDVRAAVAEEWERCRELRLRALAEAPDAFGQTLAQAETAEQDHWRQWVQGWSGSIDHALFVAEDPDGWWGMAVADVGGGTPDRAHLYGMWVDPTRRGAGIGAKLVDAVVAWARARDLRTVHLGVTESNPAAVALYRRAGFEPTGASEPLRSDSPLRCVRMERAL